MYCSNCGKELKEEWIQCPYCGTEQTGVNTPAQTKQRKSEQSIVPEQKQKKGKKFIIGAGVAVIVVILFMLLGGDSDSYMALVQEGYLGEYDTVAIKNLVESIYPNGEWGEGETTDGKGYIVEYKNKDFLIQFRVDRENKTFKLGAFEKDSEQIKIPSEIHSELQTMYETYQKEHPEISVMLDKSLDNNVLEGNPGPIKKKERKAFKSDLTAIIGMTYDEAEKEDFGLKKEEDFMVLTEDGLVSGIDMNEDQKIDFLSVSGNAVDTPDVLGVHIGDVIEEGADTLVDGYNLDKDNTYGDYYGYSSDKGDLILCQVNADNKIIVLIYSAKEAVDKLSDVIEE